MLVTLAVRVAVRVAMRMAVGMPLRLRLCMSTIKVTMAVVAMWRHRIKRVANGAGRLRAARSRGWLAPTAASQLKARRRQCPSQRQLVALRALAGAATSRLLQQFNAVSAQTTAIFKDRHLT